MSLQPTKRNSVRLLFLKIHRIIGIFIGILLIIIGTTGSLLVFHDELEVAIHPQLVKVIPQGEPLSIDAIALSVRQADPQAELEFILLPQQPEASYKVKVKSGDREIAAFINPYTGSILGWWGFESISTHFLLKIHTTLLAGKVGEIIVGICGLFLLLLCITGLTLWSGWKRLIPAFKVRWQAGKHLLAYDLHQLSGIVAVTFLILISITGVLFVLAHNSPAVLSLFFDFPQTETELVAIAPQQKPISLNEVVSIADRELPDGKTTFLAFSGERQRQVSVQKKYPDDIFATGLSSVAIDRYTGNVLSVQQVLKPTPGNKLAKLIQDFHFGTFGGITSRGVYVFVGLTPIILLITGIGIFQQRRWTKARRKTPRVSEISSGN